MSLRSLEKRPTKNMQGSAKDKPRKWSFNQTKFGVFVGFLVLLLVAGGGSRADILSLVFLRPLAILTIGYVFIASPRGSFAEFRPLLLFLASLALIIALHLVPLPPAIWGSLAGREIYMRVYDAAGLEAPWLPFTLTPERGLNSLMALSVPLAVLMLFAIQDDVRKRDSLMIIWWGAAASAFLGIAQILGPSTGGLYLYAVTNSGLPVGLLANRNHQGMLVAIGILLSGWLLAKALLRKRASVLVMTAGGGAILFFLLFLLVVGSRAGLLIGTGMLFPTVFMLYRAMQIRHNASFAGVWSNRKFRWALLVGTVMVLAAFTSAYLLSRSLAFDRLVGRSIDEELRASLLPILLDLAQSALPLGYGFGSFEAVFMRVEPIEFLAPSYLNHAHNDWLELLIDGGLPAGVLLLAFVVWFLHAAFKIVRAKPSEFNFEAFVSAIIVLAIAVSSIVDYPLRVPLMAAVFTIACGHLTLAGKRLSVAT